MSPQAQMVTCVPAGPDGDMSEKQPEIVCGGLECNPFHPSPISFFKKEANFDIDDLRGAPAFICTCISTPPRYLYSFGLHYLLLFYDFTESSVLDPAFPCLPGKETLGRFQ